MRKPNKNIFVMTAAFISVMLLIVARHHPPSRRKIKEIWHGRVYWESNTNTTMLRSSPEKVLEQVEPTPAEDSAEKTIARVSKPMIAICAATHSKSNWRSLGDTALQNMFQRYNMTIVDYEEIPIHSGSIRVTAQNIKINVPNICLTNRLSICISN